MNVNKKLVLSCNKILLGFVSIHPYTAHDKTNYFSGNEFVLLRFLQNLSGILPIQNSKTENKKRALQV